MPKFRTLPTGETCLSWGDEGYILTPLFVSPNDSRFCPPLLMQHLGASAGIVGDFYRVDKPQENLTSGYLLQTRLFSRHWALKSTLILKGWKAYPCSRLMGEFPGQLFVYLVNLDPSATLEPGGMVSFLHPRLDAMVAAESIKDVQDTYPTSHPRVFQIGGEIHVAQDTLLLPRLHPNLGVQTAWVDPGFKGFLYVYSEKSLPSELPVEFLRWELPEGFGHYDGGQNNRRF